MDYGNYEDGEIVEQQQRKTGKQNNVLPFWGNENSMNLNPLILTNIQGSSYFKVNLFKLKTYHEVVDEIYYQVKHMEPWERGSRKTGQTGMCGGVRGVGAGGIVSSAYCLLYKLYTLKLTRKQVNGLMNHTDSPYIRGIGFMYIRYTQPPADLFDWYADYLQDDEEIDVKAGGGQTMTMGQMLRLFMTKLDWFSTLFPRIPVPIQKQIEQKMNAYAQENGLNFNDGPSRGERREEGAGGADQYSENGNRGRRNYQQQERFAGSSYQSRDEREDRRPREDRNDYQVERRPERERYQRNEREERRREYPEERSATRYASEQEQPQPRRSHSEDRRRDKYEKEEKSERSSYRDEEKHSRHRSKEKKKHKKKHKHHSRSRSRSHERSERKYR